MTPIEIGLHRDIINSLSGRFSPRLPQSECEDAASEIIAVLRLRGYVLVPRDPTKQMSEAFYSTKLQGSGHSLHEWFCTAWTRVLDAAEKVASANANVSAKSGTKVQLRRKRRKLNMGKLQH